MHSKIMAKIMCLTKWLTITKSYAMDDDRSLYQDVKSVFEYKSGPMSNLPGAISQVMWKEWVYTLRTSRTLHIQVSSFTVFHTLI